MEERYREPIVAALVTSPNPGIELLTTPQVAAIADTLLPLFPHQAPGTWVIAVTDQFDIEVTRTPQGFVFDAYARNADPQRIPSHGEWDHTGTTSIEYASILGAAVLGVPLGAIEDETVCEACGDPGRHRAGEPGRDVHPPCHTQDERWLPDPIPDPIPWPTVPPPGL